jgi:hypothetical protein
MSSTIPALGCAAAQIGLLSRHALKHGGSLLRLVDRFSDYSGRFAVRPMGAQLQNA